MPITDLIPVPKAQFLDNNGLPLAFGKISTFVAGSSTPLATYTDGTGTVQNANPVVLDASGRANIWLGPSAYKIVVSDASSVQLYTVDNVHADNVPLQGLISFTAQAAPTPNPGDYDLWADSSALRLKMVNNGVIDFVVGQNTIDTLTNKTLTSPTLTSPTISNPTITGSASLATVTSAGITDSVGISTSNAGVFTAAAQANEYLTSLIGGINIYHEVQLIGQTSQTDGLAGAVKVPVSSTVQTVNGIAGYVQNNSTTTNGVGGTTQCRVITSNTKCWGGVAIATDENTGITGVNLHGMEIDVGPENPPANYAGIVGISVVLGGTAATGDYGGTAFLASGNAPSKRWFNGFATDDNRVSNAAFSAGAICATGSCSSQSIVLKAYASSVLKAASISASSNGDLNLIPQASANVIANSPILAKRLSLNQGTAYSGVDAAIVLGAGWGTTGAVSAARGFDQAVTFTVTPNGTGIALNPTLTITFKDGTFTNAPVCIARQVMGSAADASIWATPSATNVSLTWLGTPAAGQTYTITTLCTGA